MEYKGTAKLVPCLDRGFFGGAKSSARSDELRSYEGDEPLNSIGLKKWNSGKDKKREAEKQRKEDEPRTNRVQVSSELTWEN